MSPAPKSRPGRTDTSYRRRLDEIEAEQKAARERKDWRRVHELDADWNFVFRQWLGRS